MSRVGKKPIQIPTTVKVEINGSTMVATGPKGELRLTVHPAISAEIKDGKVLVTPKRSLSKKDKGLWGLYRALASNVVNGVDTGFEKKLEIEGIGYKAAVQGDELILNVGFVHPVAIKKPEGVTFTVEKNVITVSGANRAAVGQVAAEIRATKKSEPYKGKGIKYQGEKIRRKEGKKVIAAK